MESGLDLPPATQSLKVRTLLGYLPLDSIGLSLSPSSKLLFLVLSSIFGLALRTTRPFDFLPHICFSALILSAFAFLGGFKLLLTRTLTGVLLSGLVIGLIRFFMPPQSVSVLVERLSFALTISSWYMSSCLSAMFIALVLRPSDLTRLASRFDFPFKFVLLISIPLSTIDLVKATFRQCWIAASITANSKNRWRRFHEQIIAVAAPVLILILSRSEGLTQVLGQIINPTSTNRSIIYPTSNLLCKSDAVLALLLLPLLLPLINIHY